MDVDIPQSEQITQTWNKQKQTLRKAKLRRGERPKDRPPRHVVITEFEFSGLQFRQQQLQAKDVHYVRTTFIPPSYPPCTIPTENLARIHINDLRLETHHRGNCLVLRTITVPHRLTSTMTIVEDENDDVVMISLYHQGGEQKCPASEIIGKGTILIVKEPFLKTNSNGGYGLRVDHLSDVLFLDIEDERVPIKWQPRLVELDRPANQVKEEGNIAFRNKRNWEAIAKYTKALQLRATPDDLITIRRNRAAAYNNTGQYDAALSDTGFPNWDSVKYNEKSLLRAAAALYKLERFTESVETLQTLLSRYPNDEDAKKLLHRAQSRVSEQETGVYDFKKLQQEAKSSRPPHLDCATYIGPIEVGSTQSKGRGLFVTKAVKAGEWLLCEKAFCYAAADKHNTTILMEFETGNTFLGSQADLLTSIVQRLHKNPSLAPKYTGLFSGKYKTPVTESHQADGIVDTYAHSTPPPKLK